jgi:hypothetical protein
MNNEDKKKAMDEATMKATKLGMAVDKMVRDRISTRIDLLLMTNVLTVLALKCAKVYFDSANDKEAEGKALEMMSHAVNEAQTFLKLKKEWGQADSGAMVIPTGDNTESVIVCPTPEQEDALMSGKEKDASQLGKCATCDCEIRVPDATHAITEKMPNAKLLCIACSAQELKGLPPENVEMMTFDETGKVEKSNIWPPKDKEDDLGKGFHDRSR